MAIANEHLSASSTATEDGIDCRPGICLDNIPIIDLPHRWDEHGKMIATTCPIACPRCHWNGDPEQLFVHTYFRLVGELHLEEVVREISFECASCELLRCTILVIASRKGRKVMETSIRGLGSREKVDLGEMRAVVEATLNFAGFYVCAVAPPSDLDRYDVQRLWLSDNIQLTERSSEWAQKCIAECAHSHQYCQSQRNDSFLPTRLISLRRVANRYYVRLQSHDSIPPGSPYTALSYCWGDFEPACMTTAQTVDENMESIPWTKLPRTFQDAAKFTLSLGVHYLWIDSVCIIQKDQKDWQQEAGKMYAIYKNSFLTLAALSGPDSTYGLRLTPVKESLTPVAQLRNAQNTWTLYLRSLHYLDSECGDDHDLVGVHYPLLDRAWTYQERIVSPRIVFFTESEMIYQCLGDVQCECGDAQGGRRRTDQLLLKKAQIVVNTSGSPHLALPNVGNNTWNRSNEAFINSMDTAVTKDRASKIAWTWRNEVVPEYSNLEIHLPRDRLPALGAIAEQFNNVRPSDLYLAGLWSGTLLEDLLWTCSSWSTDPPQRKEKLHRPFNLPTWSWASLRNPIGYHQLDCNISPKATVVEAHCSYTEGNIFGVLEHSRLVLNGRTLPCMLEWSDHSIDRPCDLFSLKDNKRENLQLNVYDIKMDHDQNGYQNEPSIQEVHILEILTGTRSYSPDRVWKFLILRRASQGETIYTRAGVLTLHYSQGQDSDSQDSFESLFEIHSVLTTCEIQ